MRSYLWQVSTERCNIFRAVRVSAAKSWPGSGIKLLSSSYFSVLLGWGTKRPEWVPKSWSYTSHPLIGRQNRLFLAIGGLKQTQSTHKLFLDSCKSFIYWRKCPTKVCHPFWTSYIVTHSSSSFSLNLLAGYMSRCYDVTMLAATAIRLKPLPHHKSTVDGGNASRVSEPSCPAPNRTEATRTARLNEA